MCLGTSRLLPGVEMGDAYVSIECYVGPVCVPRISSRVLSLAAKQPSVLALPGRAERKTKGHSGPSKDQLVLAQSLIVLVWVYGRS